MPCIRYPGGAVPVGHAPRGGVETPPRQLATVAGGMHHTGMHPFTNYI